MTAVLTPEYVAPERTARPAYRPFAATVVNTQALSPHFTRVTFTAQDFDVFGTAGLDQRVKLLFPNTHGDLNTCVATGRDEDFLTWYHTWRALPDTERCPMRTYTIRRVNHATKTVDIDFVTHGATGPGSAWALTARPGDPLILIGPDDRSTDWRTGLDWRPGGACRFLLAGDETAVPAIASIIESLPFETKADVIMEIPTPDDQLDLTPSADVTITWVPQQHTPSSNETSASVQRITSTTLSTADTLLAPLRMPTWVPASTISSSKTHQAQQATTTKLCSDQTEPLTNGSADLTTTFRSQSSP